jgi:hypothetical protein
MEELPFDTVMAKSVVSASLSHRESVGDFR